MNSSIPQTAVTAFLGPRVKPGDRVLVAVSGGADSIALMHLVARCAVGLRLGQSGVAHVNHGLRGNESDGDEAFVAQAAKDIGMPMHVHRLAPAGLHDSGVEARCRTQRYAFFQSLMQTQGYTCTLTAHTADDVAETVLLRIMRGCGLNGLAAIHPVRADGIMRPLLAVGRQDLRDWLADNGLAFREDSSNSDIHFARNRIRAELMPRLRDFQPDIVGRLCDVSTVARVHYNRISTDIDAWIVRHVRPIRGVPADRGFCITHWQQENDPVIVAEALAAVFRKFHIAAHRRHIHDFIINARRSGHSFPLTNNWHYYPGYKDTEVRGPDITNTDPPVFRQALVMDSRTESAQAGLAITILCCDCAAQQQPISFDSHNATAFLDADRVHGALVLRSILPQDRFMPLGSRHTHPVIEYLKKRHIRQPSASAVVADDDRIIWIPFVAVSEYCRMTPATQALVRLTATWI